MRKKFWAIAVCTCMAMTLTACNDGGSEKNKTESKSNINENGDEETTEEAVKLDDVSQMADFQVSYTDSDEIPDWGKSNTQIKLNGSDAEITGNGATFKDSVITITKEGNYVLSGELENGKIVINAGEKDKVYLIMNGAKITCKDDAVINETMSDKVIITAVEGTGNVLSDGETRSDENITAAVFCKDSVTINGTGSLTVNGNYKDGITSKDKVKLIGASVDIVSTDDGIVGKDIVAVKSGILNIDSMGDGIKSTKTTNIEQGIVCVDGGTVNINSELDGIQAENFVKINGGTISISTGGGSVNESGSQVADGEDAMQLDVAQNEVPQVAAPQDMPQGEMSQNMPQGEVPQDMPQGEMPQGEMPQGGRPGRDKGQGGWGNWGERGEGGRDMQDPNQAGTEETPSAKAVKGGNGVYINGGTINIDSSDDAIHSNDMVYILDGTMSISSGDDGVHADDTLEISGGTIDITKSYEGLEAYYITLSGGDVILVSRDDGLNAAGGNDSSSMNGRPGQNRFAESASDAIITIKGGNLHLTASGDGIDSNGNIEMTDGNVTVCGPAGGGNGILDFGGTFTMDGGALLGAGTSSMFMSISSSSKHNVINEAISGSQGDEIVIYDGDKQLATFTANTNYTAVIISTPDIEAGKSYTIKYGNNETTVEAGEPVDYRGM